MLLYDKLVCIEEKDTEITIKKFLKKSSYSPNTCLALNHLLLRCIPKFLWWKPTIQTSRKISQIIPFLLWNNNILSILFSLNDRIFHILLALNIRFTSIQTSSENSTNWSGGGFENIIFRDPIFVTLIMFINLSN